MKVFISLSICLFLVCAIFFIANSNEKQLRYRLDEKIQLNGKVKSLTQVKYDLSNRDNKLELSEHRILAYETDNHLANVEIYLSSIRDTLRFYYDNFNRVQHIKLNSENVLIEMHRCLFNHGGNQAEIDEYYLADQTSTKAKVNHIDYYCGINSERGVATVDSIGNIIESKFIIHDFEIVGRVSGVYNGNGTLAEEDGHMVYDGEQHRKLNYKYENIDTFGNWLKRTTFKNDKVFEVEERKIEYY